MAYRGYPGWQIDASYGPDDCEDEPIDPSTAVVVTIWRVEVCSDGEPYTVPTTRSWPLFLEKSAHRWAAYYRRKYGERNVTIDYD